MSHNSKNHRQYTTQHLVEIYGLIIYMKSVPLEPFYCGLEGKGGKKKEKSSGNLLAETVAVTRQTAFFF